MYNLIFSDDYEKRDLSFRKLDSNKIDVQMKKENFFSKYNSFFNVSCIRLKIKSAIEIEFRQVLCVVFIVKVKEVEISILGTAWTT